MLRSTAECRISRVSQVLVLKRGPVTTELKILHKAATLQGQAAGG